MNYSGTDKLFLEIIIKSAIYYEFFTFYIKFSEINLDW